MKRRFILLILTALLTCSTVSCDDFNYSSKMDSFITEYSKTNLEAPSMKETNIIEGGEMIELFGCKAEELDSSMSSQEVTDYYIKAYEQSRGSGNTPVILALSDRLKSTIEEAPYGEYDSPDEFRKAMLSADTSNGKELFENGYNELKAEYDGDKMLIEDEEEFEELLALGDISFHLFPGVSEADQMSDSGVYLIYIPTETPWEVLAWLPFGGWNDCPDTLEMLSGCRYWYEEYNAIPAFISSDMLMFYLPEPIVNKDIARQIAREHCTFCYDNLGRLNLEALLILNSNVWKFWWD